MKYTTLYEGDEIDTDYVGGGLYETKIDWPLNNGSLLANTTMTTSFFGIKNTQHIYQSDICGCIGMIPYT